MPEGKWEAFRNDMNMGALEHLRAREREWESLEEVVPAEVDSYVYKPVGFLIPGC